MPSTRREYDRIKRMHDAGDHERCKFGCSPENPMPEDLKRQIRGHKNGDHRSCDWAHCQTRKDQEYEADETNFIKAVNDHLRDVGLDVRSFWGDGYDDTMAKASREIPDWLDQEPDPVLRIKARYEVSCVLAEEMAKDANPV